MKVSFTEVLESRTMMSASPAKAVVHDELMIQAALVQFRTDALANYATLSQDIANMKADDVKSDTVLAPLVKHMRADIKSLDASLLADRLTEKANVLADESVVTADEVQLLKDKGNATALTADHTKLRADRIKMQDDMIAGLNQRLSDRQSGYSTIFADGQAIVTALGTDPNASDKLKADVTQWTNDKAAAMTKLSGDIQTLIADRQQLVTDLTALQSV